MSDEIPRQKNNPLHGMTLQMIMEELVEYVGWEKMGSRIPINCFLSKPTIKSSLAFLRKTPWARQKVEVMYEFNWQKISKKKASKAKLLASESSEDILSSTAVISQKTEKPTDSNQ